MIHNKINFISPGCPLPSIALVQSSGLKHHSLIPFRSRPRHRGGALCQGYPALQQGVLLDGDGRKDVDGCPHGVLGQGRDTGRRIWPADPRLPLPGRILHWQVGIRLLCNLYMHENNTQYIQAIHNHKGSEGTTFGNLLMHPHPGTYDCKCLFYRFFPPHIKRSRQSSANNPDPLHSWIANITCYTSTLTKQYNCRLQLPITDLPQSFYTLSSSYIQFS